MERRRGLQFWCLCKELQPAASCMLKTTFLPWVEKNVDKIDWDNLSLNINAISILEKYLDKVNCDTLSRNKNAISILEKNLDKVVWYYLSYNINAISILEKHLDKVVWSMLSYNINAIPILEKNQKSQGKCFYCQINVQVIYDHVREPKQWTIERIDNSIGHNKGNVEISCLNCNLRRRTMHYERYLKTKQLTIHKMD